MTKKNLPGRTDRDQATEPTQLTYPISEEESPSEAVVRAVAKHTDTAILDLEPLYHIIDPEYLDGIFEKIDGIGSAEISFQYNGSTVTVTQEVIHITAETEQS